MIELIIALFLALANPIHQHQANSSNGTVQVQDLENDGDDDGGAHTPPPLPPPPRHI